MHAVLGIDPGFAKTGWCVVRLGKDRNDDLPIRMGVMKTRKSNKKLRLMAVDDNLQRAQEIASGLVSLLDELKEEELEVVAITAEALSFVRSASVSAKIGMVWGVIAALATVRQVPVMQVTPHQIKIKFCSKANTSKEAVQSAVRSLYSHVDFDTLLSRVSPSDTEHPWDALAATILCLEDKSVQMLRRLQAGG